MSDKRELKDDLLTTIIKHLTEDHDKQKKSFINNMNEQPSPFSDHTVELTEDDGFVEVRDHELFIINARKNGKQPTLHPSKQLTISINGHQLIKETVVFERDEITCMKKESPLFETKINKDKMVATLKVYPELFTDYRLKNQKRALNFKLELEAIEKICDVQAICSEILDTLYKKGIKVELNTTSIMEELIDPTFTEVIIAEGLPMIESRDGYIDVLFSREPEEILEEKNGQIDFKNRIKIPLVNAGTVIARVHPPIHGKEGYNVFCEKLVPKRGKEIEIRTKNRVKITDDGQIIALKSGRPTMTGTVIKYFDILETYEVNGDVDLKTGNIYFTGDLIIRGDVKEGMRIEATGNIYIHGNVYIATVVSSQSIYVNGTIVNSHIYGGQHGLFHSRIFQNVENLYLSFNKLDTVLKQVFAALEKENKSYHIGHVIDTLIKTKFSHLKEYTDDFFYTLEEMERNKIDIPIKFKVISRVLHTFTKAHLIQTITSTSTIDNIRFALKDVIKRLESSIEEESDILIKDANMSTIKTNGSITIRGLGIVNSQLFAGNDCIFLKKDSVIRGGSVEAVNKIVAGNVGNEKGSSPRIIAGKSIQISYLYQGKLTLQRQTFLFDESVEMLNLNYNGKTGSITGYPKIPKPLATQHS